MSDLTTRNFEEIEEEVRLGTYPVAEQELHINWMRSDSYAEIYASDKTIITKLDKLCEESPDMYKVKEISYTKSGIPVAKSYICTDKTLISFRSKKKTRELTEEQKEALVKRLADARSIKSAE